MGGIDTCGNVLFGGIAAVGTGDIGCRGQMGDGTEEGAESVWYATKVEGL